MFFNLFLFSVLLLILFSLIVFVWYDARSKEEKKTEDNPYQLPILQDRLKQYFYDNTKEELHYKHLTKQELLKIKHQKIYLHKALHECNLGSAVAKRFVKEQIKGWLQSTYQITPENINSILPFHDVFALSCQDKFEILMYRYKTEYGAEAFSKLLSDYELWNPKQREDTPYEITKEQIHRIFDIAGIRLGFTDKLEIVAQRLYQNYKGHGPVDELRDMNIDGVSAGVSGALSGNGESMERNDKITADSNLKNSIWVFFRGLMIHLSFLSFSTTEELQKICRNIYRYGKPGQLSAVRGYIVNEMMDGSRVVVVRPPFAESWSFFIRKFDYRGVSKITDLIIDQNASLVITLLRLLIRGEQIIGITGEQGSGKTTLLKSLIQFIPPSYTLRVQELVFELHLREIYPERNIVSFRETAEIQGREGLDLQKKTDGTVNIIGEVASAPVASWLVMVSQVASKYTIFTHHAKTTKHLVMALRNDLMITGAFQNEHAAQMQVKASIRFDVHVAKDCNGHRYIERVSEIEQNLQEEEIIVRDIIRYERGKYHLFQIMSDATKDEIFTHLSIQEKDEYRKLFQKEERGHENYT